MPYTKEQARALSNRDLYIAHCTEYDVSLYAEWAYRSHTPWSLGAPVMRAEITQLQIALNGWDPNLLSGGGRYSLGNLMFRRSMVLPEGFTWDIDSRLGFRDEARDVIVNGRQYRAFEVRGFPVCPRCKQLAEFLNHTVADDRKGQACASCTAGMVTSVYSIDGFEIDAGMCDPNATLPLVTTYGYAYVTQKSVQYFKECRTCHKYHLRTKGCHACDAKRPTPGKMHGYHEVDPTLLGWFPCDSPGTRYFGIEIEVLATDLRQRKHLTAQSTALPWLVCSRDGSLDDARGVEIVTAPHSFEAMRARFRKGEGKAWREWLRDASGHNHPECGIHIHVTRSTLTPETIGRLRSFLFKSVNSAFLDIVSQRVSNRYCVRSVAGESRYEALNVVGEYTIEFRLFRSNTRCDRIIKNLEFVQSLIEFCEGAPKFLTWRRYVAWLSRRVDSYPYLCAFLMEHHVSTDAGFLAVSRRMSLSQETDSNLLTEDFYAHLIGDDSGQPVPSGV
jgi:hypothetical protein